MKQILLFIILMTTSAYSQELSTKNQLIIRDVVGDVQVRSAHAPTWKPLIGGRTVSENSFIRLNTKDSSISISYPDGGNLRLMGLGSYFFEQVSRAQNNIYHSKILVFSGRWFFQAHTNSISRFIANTDITTSVVEQGAGGGVFVKGTNEFVLLQGRGLISYRQKDINALVLDERQYVHFNIFEGFFQPKLVTDQLLEQYMIFTDRTTMKKEKNYSDIQVNNQNFSYKKTPHYFSYYNKLPSSKKSHTTEEIDGTKLLQELYFPKRKDREQGTILTQKSNEEDLAEVFKNIKPKKNVIPKELLKAIDIDDFQIKVKTNEPSQKINEPSQVKKRKTPKRKRQPRIKAPKTTASVYDEELEEDIAQPETDIDALMDELGESFNQEQSELESSNRKRRKPRLIIEEELPEVVEEIVEETPPPPPVVEEPKPKVVKKRRVRRQQPIKEEVEEEQTGFNPGDSFFNRNLDDPAYHIDKFRLESVDDIMNSDLSVLFSM